jgi:hypothetical protein
LDRERCVVRQGLGWPQRSHTCPRVPPRRLFRPSRAGLRWCWARRRGLREVVRMAWRVSDQRDPPLMGIGRFAVGAELNGPPSTVGLDDDVVEQVLEPVGTEGMIINAVCKGWLAWLGRPGVPVWRSSGGLLSLCPPAPPRCWRPPSALTLISKGIAETTGSARCSGLAGAAARGGGSAGRSHPAGIDRNGATAALHGRCAARRQPQRARTIRRVDRLVDDVLTPGRQDDPQPQRAHARGSDRGPAPTPPDAAAGPAGPRVLPARTAPAGGAS